MTKLYLLIGLMSTLIQLTGNAQDSTAVDNCAQLDWEGRTDIPMLYVVARYPKPSQDEIYRLERHTERNEPTAGAYTRIDTSRLPGETTHFLKYLNKQIKYPKIAIEMAIQGKVFFTFEVDSEGYTRNFQIKRGLAKFIDQEVHSAVMKAPKMVFKEGALKDNGLPEGCYRMAIIFKLN